MIQIFTEWKYQIKTLTYGEDNILMNIGYEIKKLQENMENEQFMDML